MAGRFYAVAVGREYLSLSGKLSAVPALYFDEGVAKREAERLGGVVEDVQVGHPAEPPPDAPAPESPAADVTAAEPESARVSHGANAGNLRVLTPGPEKQSGELLDDLDRWSKKTRREGDVRAVAAVALVGQGEVVTALMWDTGDVGHVPILGALELIKQDIASRLNFSEEP